MKASVVLLLCAFLCLAVADNVVPCTSGACGPAGTGACVAHTVDGLVDDWQPKLDNSFTSFTNNQLTVAITGSYVTGRQYTGLYANTGAANTCAFGSAAFWNANFDPATCVDQFMFTLSWADHVSCGFALDAALSTDTVAVYRADLTLEYTDNFVTAGTPMSRTHSVPYSLYVNFPLTVDISVEAFNVSSVVTSGFALTGDHYDPATSTLTLTLTTVLNWPNEFASPFTIAGPTGISWVNQDTLIWGTDACTTDANSQCIETITFDVKLDDANGCQFDGTYTVSGWIYTCRLAAGNVGDDCTTEALDVQFTISSSDVCGKISVTPALSGNLVALQGPYPSALQGSTPYTLGTSGYFYADIRSAGNTVYLQFDNVTAVTAGVVGATPISLLSSGVNTAAGTSAQFAKFDAAKYFSVYFTSAVFAVPPRTSVQYIFNAQCYITFEGNQKRAVEFTFTVDAQSTSASTKAKITNNEVAAPADTAAPANAAANNQTALIAGIVGGVAGVALLTIGAALLIRRYRAKAAASAYVKNSA